MTPTNAFIIMLPIKTKIFSPITGGLKESEVEKVGK